MNKGLEALKVLIMSSTTIFNTKEQITNAKEIIEKELKTKDALLKLILQFFDEELKENFKTICASDINIEIGKETFTKEEYDLLKEVLL